MARQPQLSPRQREMLRLVVRHGRAFAFVRAAFRSVWAIRTGAPGAASIPRTFPQATGQKLVDLGYLERDPDGDVIGSEGLIARCFVVSADGVGRVTQRGSK